MQTVGRACEDIGFLVVEGHGVDPQVIDQAESAAQAFFARPLEDKMRCVPSEAWHFRGYEPVGGSALARSLDDATPPDLCELYRISRFDDPASTQRFRQHADLKDHSLFDYFFGPNLWPEEPAELRPALTAYYRELEQLAATMMEIFARALDLPADWFAASIDEHITNLCVNHYPVQTEPPRPGQLRRGAHSDYGSMTILHQNAAPGGLQVLAKEGTWLDVPYRPETFIVNLGDLLARWTNDRWVSTMHRVVNPPADQADTDRVSIPFFHQPNFDAVIECLPGCSSADNPPRYEPTTSGRWVLGKTRKQVGVEPSPGPE